MSVCVTAHLQSCNSLCVCACVCWRASSWKHIHSRQEEKRSTTAFICSLLPMCHRSSMSRIELRVRAPATKKKVNYVSCVSTPIRSRHTPFWTKKGNQKDDKKRWGSVTPCSACLRNEPCGRDKRKKKKT